MLKYTQKEFEKLLKDTLISECGVTLDVASENQIYRCLAAIVRQIMSDKQKKFQARAMGEGKKQVYYLCMEFLMGRSLRKRKPTQQRFEPLVTAPFVSVTSRVAHMLRGLLQGTLRRMGQLFSREESRSTNVATFLALLELIRAGRVRIRDDGGLEMDRRKRRATTERKGETTHE